MSVKMKQNKEQEWHISPLKIKFKYHDFDNKNFSWKVVSAYDDIKGFIRCNYEQGIFTIDLRRDFKQSGMDMLAAIEDLLRQVKEALCDRV